MKDRTVKKIVEELLDMTEDEACMYLEDNHSEEDREKIVAAIWETYHEKCCSHNDQKTVTKNRRLYVS